MKYTKLFGISLFFLVLVLFSNVVSAYGIAPASYNYDNQEGDVRDLTIRILNTQQEDLTLYVYAKGSEYDVVKFEKQHFSLRPSDAELTIPYSVNLGSSPKPGVHEIEIVVVQLPKGSNEFSESSVDIVSTIVQKVNVFVPYPGKYLIGTLYAQESESEKAVTFTARVTNKGTEPLVASGYVLIKDASGMEISQVPFNPLEIKPSADGKMQISYSGFASLGTYTAQAIINYEGQELELTDNFVIGQDAVTTVNIRFGSFNVGQIIKVMFDIKNNWNQEVSAVYGDVRVTDEEGRLVSEFRTNDLNIPSEEIGELIGYWDTESLNVGRYSFNLILHHRSRSIEHVFDLVMGLNEINVVDGPFAGNVVGNDSSSSSKVPFLILVIIVLIGVNIFVVMKLKKKK